MNAPKDVRGDARTSQRFVPREALSIAVAGGTDVPVHGNVRDISPVGACVATDHILEHGRAVTLDVRCGYDFLFQAGARIVWQTQTPLRESGGLEPFESLQGMRFTELSPFSRSLILRLKDNEPERTMPGGPWMRRLDDAESDPDLGILYRSDDGRNGVTPAVAGKKAELGARDGDDRFDLLSDPELERLLYAEWALESELSAHHALTGNLEQFDVTVVLQMLEVTRATGVLYLEGVKADGIQDERFGELHFEDGRICGCFSRTGEVDEAPFRWVLANRGRFSFATSKVRKSLGEKRSTTALLLEWQIKSNEG